MATFFYSHRWDADEHRYWCDFCGSLWLFFVHHAVSFIVLIEQNFMNSGAKSKPFDHEIV